MGGFVWNKGVHEVMSTYTPEQLPVLNGLAKAFAVSDEWFCSMPDATTPNAHLRSPVRRLALDNFIMALNLPTGRTRRIALQSGRCYGLMALKIGRSIIQCCGRLISHPGSTLTHCS